MTEAQLRAFVAVAECGSFAEAARKIHMSQPGVSRAVRTLEDELGDDLLIRSTGSITLTGLGETALVRSRIILAEVDAMRQEVDRRHGVVSGRVRLGSMPSVSSTVLPALLAHIEQRHPALAITVLDGHDDELVGWARDGLVDVAVVAGRHAGLSQQPLLEDEFLAVLPTGHRLAQGSTVARSAFEGEPFILTKAGCERLVLAALSSAGVTPRVRYEVTEASTILAMVDEGLGISIMPRLAALKPPANVTLLPLRPQARRRLSFAHASIRNPTPACAVFLAEVAAWRTSTRMDPWRAPARGGRSGRPG